MPMPLPGVDFDEADHPAVPENHPLLNKIKSAFGATGTQWGFDYAWESATVSELIRILESNSADFVARYINDPGGKGITSFEAAALEAAGILIAPVFETSGTDFTAGYSAGVSDGQAAAGLLHARGAPAGSYCWFAIDTDTSDYAATNAYLRGAKAGTGQYVAQLYGKNTVCDQAAAAGLGSNHWQTYAWSAGQLSSHAALYQYQNGVMISGISMDRDRTLKAMQGPWAHFGATPPPPPPPPPPVTDWTETMIQMLPTLGPSDRDLTGQVQYVHRIQALVKVIGQINTLPAASAVVTDGVYGPQTISGVKAVQNFFGLSQDGITGQATWHHLVTGG